MARKTLSLVGLLSLDCGAGTLPTTTMSAHGARHGAPWSLLLFPVTPVRSRTGRVEKRRRPRKRGARSALQGPNTLFFDNLKRPPA